MPATLKTTVDIGAALEVFETLSRPAVVRAWRRAMRKTGQWVAAQATKQLAQSTGVPRSVIRSRLYFFLRSMDRGKVWLGVNAIEAHRLGTPRQTKTGVSVGRFEFAHAWLMKHAKPKGPVYRRVGRQRTPVAEVTYEFDRDAQIAFDKLTEQVEDRLLQILSQELRYENMKAKRNGTD